MNEMLQSFAEHGCFHDPIGRTWTPGPLPGTQLCRDDILGLPVFCLYANEPDLPPHVRKAFAELRQTGVTSETGVFGEPPHSWLLPDETRRYCLGSVWMWDVEVRPARRDLPLPSEPNT